MKILKLRLKKFIGIQKGLGLDEITIDISKLSGLVALSGDNGNGKTTVLECLHPYARLVSRKGALQYHTYGRDAEKELDFEFNGDIYKTLIKIDSDSGRSEGFIWKNGKPEIDGKISNYSKYILELMGSPELFFNSVFCGQGSKKLNDMKPADLKNLFSEFLRLDKLIAYEDTSKQCNNLLTSRAASLERDIESLKILTEGYSEASALLAYAKGEKAGLKQNLLELSKDLEKSEAKFAVVQTDIQKNRLIKTELAGLQNTQNRLSAEIEEDQKQSEFELLELRTKYRTMEIDIAKLDSLLTNKDEIKQAVASKIKLTAGLTIDRESLADLTRKHFAAIGAVSKKEAEANEASSRQKRKIDLAKNNTKTLELKLKHAQLKEADLDKRDPECVSKTCSFILSALTAQQDIPILTRTIKEQAASTIVMEKAYPDSLKTFTAGIGALRDKESAMKIKKETIEAKISQFEDNLNKVDTLADELPKVETALYRKKDIEKRQAENVLEGKKRKALWDIKIGEKNGQEIITGEMINKKKAQINIKTEEKIITIQQSISSLKSAITERTDEIADKAADIIKHEQEVTRKEQSQEELTVKTAERELLINEAGDWKYLKDACGKDGLRALEIDSVAPVISAYANNLLISAFGPDATVSIKTQNDEGREILDIQVIDGDGDEVPLGSRSGGEQQWALKAMRLAMAMISKEKSGKDFQTILSDEETGPLDDENAQKYILLYRKFMEQGGFETCFYISHNANCVAMADHVIKLGNGKISIN